MNMNYEILKNAPYSLNEDQLSWVRNAIENMNEEEKIGQIFGGRKHTTVMHGCDNVNEDPELKKQAEEIYKLIT